MGTMDVVRAAWCLGRTIQCWVEYATGMEGSLPITWWAAKVQTWPLMIVGLWWLIAAW